MSDSVILTVDTSQVDTSIVSISYNNKITTLRKKSKINKAQNTLSLIHTILLKNNLQFTNIKKVIVNTGPGSLVGIRVGLTIAKTLGFLLQVPVNSIKLPVSG